MLFCLDTPDHGESDVLVQVPILDHERVHEEPDLTVAAPASLASAGRIIAWHASSLVLCSVLNVDGYSLGAMMDAHHPHVQIDAAAAESQAEDEWYDRNRQLLETAYLASDNPQQQSGLTGDAAHWKRRRHVIVDAIDHDGTLLDVGCANGLLMETLVAWAEERGYHLEPYGVDISPKLVALARSRLPGWTDRISVGNVITWDPPRQFDYVRTELVYVPSQRQPDLVARLMERVVAPGGRLVVCAYRPHGVRDADPIGELLRSWGFPVSGEATAADIADGGIATRVAWLDVDH
jgi:SAM-dependent methyltransferase